MQTINADALLCKYRLLCGWCELKNKECDAVYPRGVKNEKDTA